MTRPLLFFAAAATAAAYDVTIVGKPSLQQTLMPSIEFSGGGTQLTVRVRVVDDNGSPASGVMVRVSAQAGASLSRLRGLGVSDRAGIATVVTAWDLPVVSLRNVTLTACIEPEGDCSKTGSYDLRRRYDLEAESNYSENAGTQVYYNKAAPGGNTGILSNGMNYAAVGRLVMNLYSGGSLSHTNQWSAFAEGGGYLLHSTTFGTGVAYFGGGGMYVLRTFTDTGFHPSAQFGVQGQAWGRLFTAVSPPISGNPGILHGQAMWGQPVTRGVEVIVGGEVDQPQFGNKTNVYGSVWAPLFGFAFTPKRSAALSFTALGSWESAGASSFHDGSGAVWTVPATKSPGVQLSVNYHRGGLAYISFNISGQNLTTNSKQFSAGTTVTLRDFLRRGPK